MAFTPICVPCAREMRCKKNGYNFLDYQAAAVWRGDLYECERCKRQVVVGVGRAPVVESYQPQFDALATRSAFQLRRELPHAHANP